MELVYDNTKEGENGNEYRAFKEILTQMQILLYYLFIFSSFLYMFNNSYLIQKLSSL